MTRTEYMLSRDIGNWLFYAQNQLNLSENEATVMWNNKHNIGKYLVCESREDMSTRLFIRNVTNILEDSFKKEGWWNTFTVTKTPTKKGLWLSKVVEYRLDRNGFLNLEVEIILPVDDVKFRTLFSLESREGTWNSIAWWLMMVRSEAFLDEYNFPKGSFHQPNFKALAENFIDLKGLNECEIGKEMLKKYIKNEVTLDDIENCLNTPSEWEKLVSDIQKAVVRCDVNSVYGEKYPLFSKKVVGNVVRNGFVQYDLIDSYLKRQVYCYGELVSSGKIEKVLGGVLDVVERVLLYRKSLKDAEKAVNREKRKARG